MALLRARDLTKTFGPTRAVDCVSLSVDEGEIICLLGPSGCGKSTLLRLIAGLETPDSGALTFDGHDLGTIPVHKRDFGLMFQDFALFPHRGVGGNVAFGLEMRRWSRAEITTRVQETLALVGVAGFGARDVNELSGGERQRVALARSLAPRPRLLMLDEPLGSLDRTLRERLMDELRHILTNQGVTAIYVTHDQQEAFVISDRVMIMRDGRIVQSGTPEAVYRSPLDDFVARFLGLDNILPGRVVEINEGHVIIETPIGPLQAALNEAKPPSPGAPIRVLIHPEGANLVTQPGGCPDCNVVQGVVQRRSFRGSDYLLRVRPTPAGSDLTFMLPAYGHDGPPAPGEAVTLNLYPETLNLWLASDDQAI